MAESATPIMKKRRKMSCAVGKLWVLKHETRMIAAEEREVVDD